MQKSINARVLQFTKKVLHSAPLNWDDLFKRCGIAKCLQENPDQFISLEKFEMVFRLAVEETNDNYLVVRHFDNRQCYFQPTLFGGLLSLAANMKELNELFEHYNQMQNCGAFYMKAEEKNDSCHLLIDVHTDDKARIQYADLLLLQVNWMIQELSGQGFQAQRLDLVRQTVDPTFYSRHFGVIKIHTGMPQLSLCSKPEVFGRRFRQRQSHLLQAMKSTADEKLKGHEDLSIFSQKVREVLMNNIGSNAISSDDIAEQLGMSRSSLHRHLNEDKTSYQKLLDEVRFDNACRFLLETSIDTWEIASMLGFSCDSSFRRFFKSQSQMTPRSYRKKHQN